MVPADGRISAAGQRDIFRTVLGAFMERPTAKYLNYPKCVRSLRRRWRGLKTRVLGRPVDAHRPIVIRALSDGRRMLNVGCGNRFHRDWTNVDHIAHSPDIIVYDITRGLPFDDDVFDVVYHSHIIEHLPPHRGRVLMDECFRVLRPGGIIRVVAPDLEFACRLYLRTLEDLSEQDNPRHREHYEWALLNLLDQMVRTRSGGEMAGFLGRDELKDFDFIVANAGGSTIRETRENLRHARALQESTGELVEPDDNIEKQVRFRQQGEVHRWMYDRYSLPELLRAAGFEHIGPCSSGASQIADWHSFHLDCDTDGTPHKPGSLFYEAIKPGP